MNSNSWLILTMVMVNLANNPVLGQKLEKLSTKLIYEQEPSPSIVRDDLDYLGSYVYVLNADKIPRLFNPENYTSEQRKEFGIRSGTETQSFFLTLIPKSRTKYQYYLFSKLIKQI